MADAANTPSRDALLAEVRRALSTVRPERADSLLQELEYATGRDPRPVSARAAVGAPPRPELALAPEAEMLGPLLAAVNDVESRLPYGRRVTWHARVTPVVDTTVYVLGIEAEPIGERTRAAVLASWFVAAFAPELDAIRESVSLGSAPGWLLPRLAKLAPGDPDAEVQLQMHVINRIAPQQDPLLAGLPPAPARFAVLPGVSAALRECFPERAESLVEGLWSLLAAPPPRAKAVRHDGGNPGRTPRELALQVVELMNAVEREQPEGLRAQWSASPAPGGAIEVRGAAAG